MATSRSPPWITHRSTFQELASDFERITDPTNGVIKAMIDVTEG